MTKFISIAISFLILVQSFHIGIGEIVELDELIEHAQFHSEEYGDNFLVFLSKHYGELKAEHSQKHQEEQEEHEEMPFQHQAHTVTLSAFVLNEAFLYTSTPEFRMDSATNYFYQASYSLFEKDGPFQPPRHA
ncbi:hypothetical protein GGR42_002170 [Saonia flava]|uniref:Uncharacterized protein n=1 Tax=Saonia flava TaxID=523696 RepID=A0A846QUJ7_9FLAO|nr:hypothetical protein [Saonia flava]NJB71708.1 hypothetical protein [Saonia flava]